ncbi:hypothetical protein SAMN05660226_01970 [Parapedobacter luteus]|uniref:HD domain-containing protein n=1 Tax=Parapedobacter luteus TaxID=623280 RepID=A0A1T5C882_9SPHI|nr:HD domain-containing protein [Parapedobacter luteus]SKB55792.1 hypothetical protein SAMN05660226_01970 [Parapedobacter luteus]
MRLDLAEHYILNRLENELPPGLTYHNALHTADVYAAARQIAVLEGIPDLQLQWLLTAALYHDAGFLVQTKAHELSSCAIAQETLPGFGYTDADITVISKLIMATEIPQRPRQHLEEIICDADLDYLGRDDFFDRSLLLYQEMHHLGTISSREEFEKIQIAFLDKHHYFTETSKRRRNAKKEENYKKLLT